MESLRMTLPPAAPAAYRPGTCNIGPAEIERRRRTGWLAVAAALALAGIVLAWGLPSLARLVVAGPFAIGFVSLLQARRRFCAAYGLAGLAGFGRGPADARAVEDPEARAADRAAAWRLVRDATVPALVLAGLLVLLPA